MRFRGLIAAVVVAVGVVGTTGCELHDSNGNGTYDPFEIQNAIYEWWHCDVLGGLGGLNWSCNPHL